MKDWVAQKWKSIDVAGTVQGKLAEGQEWVARTMEESQLAETMQGKLTVAMDGAFESIIEGKRIGYLAGSAQRPAADSVQLLIQSCATTNAAISGGAGLVPGPLGMLAVVPEIALIMRNQIAMIYDIAVAHGKEDAIEKELLASVFLAAMGTSAGGLLVMHGSKLLVKRSSLRVFQKIVAILAGKMTQKALKAAISKWVPIVGAAFMAWLSNHLTRNIGRKADEIFRKDIVLVAEIIEEVDEVDLDAGSAEAVEVVEEK